jgi:hypothetical protein
MRQYFLALFYPGNELHLAILIFLPLLAGLCIYLTKKWSFGLYIILMFITFVYSYTTWADKPSTKILIFFLLLYLINITIVGYFMLPAVRKIYFDPRIRWWETKPRYLTDFSAHIFMNEESTAEGMLKNISVGGFYIESAAELELQQDIKLCFHYGNNEYTVVAKPVFRRQSDPIGYGFQVSRFEAKKAHLSKIVNDLKKEGAVVLGRAPGPEDSFVFWFRRAIRSKSVWIPEVR